jgi:hypothetical protein
MTPLLRPMTLGEILDRTFHIYRSRFPVFVGIGALPALAMLVLETANQFWWNILPDPYGPTFFRWIEPQKLAYELALAHGSTFFSILLWPAYAVAASKAVFADPGGISGSLSVCMARSRSWIGLGVASWSLQFLLPEVMIGGSMVGAFYLTYEVMKADPNDPLHTGPLVLAACMALGWIAFRWIGTMISMSAPAWAIEGLGIRASIRRARKLSKGRRLQLLTACLMPASISWIATLIVSSLLPLLRSGCTLGFDRLILIRVAAPIFTGYELCLSQSIVHSLQLAADAVILDFIGPLYPIALTLFYYDQRIRHEGYDIEQMMDAAGLNPPAVSPAEAPAAGVSPA